MANRKTCFICSRTFVHGDLTVLRLHRYLCPEHKRLRNRMQRRAAGEGDTAND